MNDPSPVTVPATVYANSEQMNERKKQAAISSAHFPAQPTAYFTVYTYV